MSDINWGTVLLATIQGGLIGVGLYYVNRWQQRRKEKAASQSDVPSISPVATERLASPASPTSAPVAPESSPPNSATGRDGEDPQYCGQCGQPVVATAKFCGGCGAAIQSPVVIKPSAPPPPPPVPVTPTPTPVEVSKTATPPAGNTGRTKPRWGLVAAGVALVAILVAGGMYVYERQTVSYLERASRAATPEEAVRLYRLAADRGDAEAQTNLGYMYFIGDGVPQDDVQAVRWYRLAADQGHPIAQFNLGIMYDQGLGVPQDDVEAVRWYRLAANQGYAAGQNSLGSMYDEGDGVSQDDAEAVRWYRLAADQGYAPAQVNTGYMYSQGRGVPQNRAEAERWYRLAAEQGDPTAQYNLGVIYDNGRVVPMNLTEAERWYRLAADQGHVEAQRELDRLTAELEQTRSSVITPRNSNRTETNNATGNAPTNRIGGNIVPPEKLRDVRPIYPPAAQAARVQGTVVLEVVIGPTGDVTEVTVIESIPLLDEAAMTAVKQWKYAPTVLNGEAVPLIMTATVNFSLQ